MSAKTISWLLAKRNNSPFYARQQLAVVPNVSWGLLPWEADLLALSKAGYLSEVEIKISMSDWKADLDKGKHSITSSVGYPSVNSIKRFYYAGPKKLMSRYQEIAISKDAGIIAVEEERIEVLRPAVDRKAVRMPETEVMKLLRLAALKAWRMAYDPAADAAGWAYAPEEHEINAC